MSKSEDKTPVLVRMPDSMHTAYLKMAADAMVARGKQMSVPKLVLENLTILEEVRKLVIHDGLSDADKVAAMDQLAALLKGERESE